LALLPLCFLNAPTDIPETIDPEPDVVS
jgi:hypothetical protein